jgi:hypothetical protein
MPTIAATTPAPRLPETTPKREIDNLRDYITGTHGVIDQVNDAATSLGAVQMKTGFFGGVKKETLLDLADAGDAFATAAENFENVRNTVYHNKDGVYSRDFAYNFFTATQGAFDGIRKAERAASEPWETKQRGYDVSQFDVKSAQRQGVSSARFGVEQLQSAVDFLDDYTQQHTPAGA